MLTVKNKSRQLFTLNLRPDIDYGDHPACQHSEKTFHVTSATPDGEVGTREVVKTLSGSLTWLAGEVKTKLPVNVALIPEFKAACDAGILVVVQS